MPRRAKLALTVAIALMIAWLAWSYIAHRRLQAKIDEMIAEHRPVYFTDLDFSSVPDNQNAAIYYKAASIAMSSTYLVPGSSPLLFPPYPPYTSQWQSTVDQAVAADKQSLALLRRARQFDRADWGVRPTQSGNSSSGIALTSFSGVGGLAELLADGALQAHSHGDDPEALQRILDGLQMADAVEQRTFAIGRQVATGVRSVTVGRIEVMAIDLNMGPNRREVKNLINQLLDEKKSRDALMAMARYQSVDDLSVTLRQLHRATILRPLIYLSASRILDADVQYEIAISQPNWRAAEAIGGQPPLSGFPFNGAQRLRFSRIVDLSFGPTQFSRPWLVEFRELAEFRMAAASLAVNLYHIDHSQWPANLQSLVPDYLPAVPEDPFYAAPQPLGYMVYKGFRPLIFCDTSGFAMPSLPPKFPVFSWSNSTGTRQWRDVTNWWQRPAPSTETRNPKPE